MPVGPLSTSTSLLVSSRRVVNGLTRMAIRASGDRSRLPSRCATSSYGSPADRVSGLGFHMVSPKAFTAAAQLFSVPGIHLYADSTYRLLWRAYQVVQTPNEILVDKLGLDIPPAPEIILEEILSREIHIAWKQPEPPSSIHKHIVYVNGKKGLFPQA
jgi:hypothetical protein